MVDHLLYGNNFGIEAENDRTSGKTLHSNVRLNDRRVC